MEEAAGAADGDQEGMGESSDWINPGKQELCGGVGTERRLKLQAGGLGGWWVTGQQQQVNGGSLCH